MRTALRSISATGFVVFVAVVVGSVAGPRFFERQAREALVEHLRAEALEKHPTLGPVAFGAVTAALKAPSDRVRRWTEERVDRIVARVVRDVQVFAVTNAVMFLLAFLMASAETPARSVTIISGALVAGATVGTWLYLFAQSWLHTVLFSEYVGAAYVVWVALIVAAELDVLLNRARVTNALLGGIAAVLP